MMDEIYNWESPDEGSHESTPPSSPESNASSNEHEAPEQSVINARNACRIGDVRSLRTIIESGESVNGCDSRGWYPSHEAAFAGNTECLRLVIEQDNLDVDQTTYDGFTALHYAAEKGRVECVRLLLSHKANPDLQCDDQTTPLHLAISNLRTECAWLLINEMDEMNTQDSNDNTPIYLAAEKGMTEIVQVLLDKGCDLSLRTDYQATPIFAAAQFGHYGCLKLLVSAAIKQDMSLVDSPAEDGATPLYLAAQEGHLKCVSLLLKNGANPTRTLYDGPHCPLTAAVVLNHEKCAYVLWKSRPCSMWMKCQPDLLHMAIQSVQDVKMIKMLLQLGCKHNHPRTVDLLDIEFGYNIFYTYLIPTFGERQYFRYDKLTPVTFATLKSENMAMAVLDYKPRVEPYPDECPTILAAILERRGEVVECLLDTFMVNIDYHYPDWLVGNLSVILSLSRPEILIKLLKSGAEVDSVFRSDHESEQKQTSIGKLFNSVSFMERARLDSRTAGKPWSMSAIIRLMLEFTGSVKLDPSLQSTVSTRHWAKLTKVTDNTYSLEHLCRRKVRQCLGSKKLRSKEFVNQLELPVNVVSYLMYDDITYKGITQIMSDR